MTFKTTMQRACACLAAEFSRAAEACRDFAAGLMQPRAMPADQRRLDEFKLAAGGITAGIGVLELSPVTATGGAIPAWEALRDFEAAGHKWRQAHPSR